MQEGHGAPTGVMTVELIDGIAADGGKGCKDMTACVGHCIGHHAAVGETAAVETLTVKGVFGVYVLDDSL